MMEWFINSYFTALYPCLVGPQMIGEDARNGGLQGAISLRKVASNNDPDRCLISEEDANTATSMAGAVVTTVTKTVAHRSGVTTPSYWRRTLDDVTQLKTQIEDLKKVSLEYVHNIKELIVSMPDKYG